MARNDIISKLYAKKGTALEFNYDALMAPPLTSLIPIKDIEYMNKLVTSIKYTSKIDYKESEIKRVMTYYGFKRFASGTHRVVYRHLDIPTIIAKISLNKSSLGDNIREMHNQYYLKPFCTKVFDVYPTGLIGLFERVEPFQSVEEFTSVAGDIFDFINTKIIGKYVVDDIGTESFMNYGIRKAGPYSDISFGPVLLDFTEVFPLDGDKLYCNKIDHGYLCGGTLDYDSGFNTIICTKCGKRYEARELQQTIANQEVIKKGETTNMKMVVKRNGKVIKNVDSSKMGTSTIQPPKKKEMATESQMDMIGTPAPRKYKKGGAVQIHPSVDKYNESNNEKKSPVVVVRRGKIEEEKPVAEEVKDEAKVEYDTDSGFIPKPEEVKAETQDIDEAVDTEDAVEEAVETESCDDNEMSEDVEVDPDDELSGDEDDAAIDPEEELGSDDSEPVDDAVDPEDELGDEDISIDPAAVAASMMGGDSNPFVK